MSAKNSTALEVALSLGGALEWAGIDYAIGGSIAYSFYGVPRATNDVDVNVFPSEASLPMLTAALRQAGCIFDENRALAAVARGNDFGAECRGQRVDVFPPSLPLHASAHERTRRVRVEERGLSILSPEDVVLFKTLWNREGDWVDIRKVIAFTPLDWKYVDQWVRLTLPSGDGRIDRLLAMRP